MFMFANIVQETVLAAFASTVIFAQPEGCVMTKATAEHYSRETLADSAGQMQGASVKGLAGDHMTMVNVKLDKGFVLPMHSHLHEQLVYVVSGRLKLSYEDRPPVEVGPGEFTRWPPYVAHETEALEDTETVEVFGPARNELLKGF